MNPFISFQVLTKSKELILATYLNPNYKAHFFRKSDPKENTHKLLLNYIEENLILSKPDESDPSINISESNESVHENSLERKMKNIIKANSKSNELV